MALPCIEEVGFVLLRIADNVSELLPFSRAILLKESKELVFPLQFTVSVVLSTEDGPTQFLSAFVCSLLFNNEELLTSWLFLAGTSCEEHTSLVEFSSFLLFLFFRFDGDFADGKGEEEDEDTEDEEDIPDENESEELCAVDSA